MYFNNTVVPWFPDVFPAFRMGFSTRGDIGQVMAIKMLAIDHLSRGVVSDDGFSTLDIFQDLKILGTSHEK